MTVRGGPRATTSTKKSRGDLAYETIRRDIIRCVLEPGLLVSKLQLAERYGLSPGVVRPALERLGQDGLVQILPREGYLITPITIGYVEDLWAARLAAEPVAARLAAARILPDQIEQLHHLSGLDNAAQERGDTQAAEDANLEFHLGIARSAGIERLAAFIGALIDDSQRLWYFGFQRRSRDIEDYHEHQAIIDALAGGDGQAAERAMTGHLESGRAFAMAELAANPNLREVALAGINHRS